MVACLAVLAAGTGSPAFATARPTVAVLPGQPRTAELGDRATDQVVRRILTDQLLTLGSMRVVPYTSAGQTAFPPERGARGRAAFAAAQKAATDLGADVVVWVTVRERDGRWQARSVIGHVADDQYRNGPAGTTGFQELFPVLAEIVKATAETAGVPVEEGRQPRLYRLPTPDPAAFKALGLALVTPIRSPASEAKAVDALRRDPAFAEAQMHLARVYHARGGYAAAVQAYERVRRLRPEQPHLNYNLGLAYRALGDYEQAIEAYVRARHDDPYDPDIATNLGTAYYLAGRLKDARDAFRAAVKLAPYDRRAAANLQTVEDALAAPLLAPEAPASAPQAAAEAPAPATAAPPTPGPQPRNIDPQVYVDTGAIFFTRGEYERAMVEYEKALAAKPDDRDTMLRLGQTYQRLGRHADAVAMFKRALDRDPTDGEARKLLDDALATERITRGATDGQPLATRTGITDTDIAQTYYLKGKRHFVRGEYADAIAAYTRALQVTPQDVDILNSLGVAQFEAGDRAAAQRSFAKALRLAPNEASVQRNIEALRSARDRAQLEEADRTGAFSLISVDVDPALAPELEFVAGNRAYAAGAYAAAEAAYRRALALNEQHGKAWNNLGATLVRLERYNEAGRAFARAAAVLDDKRIAENVETVRALASYADATAVDKDLTITLREDPDVAYRYLMAQARDAYQSESYDAAADLYQKAAATAQTNPLPLNNLAAVYYRQGHLDRARDTIERALARDAEYPAAKRNRTIIARALDLKAKGATEEQPIGIVLQYGVEQPAESESDPVAADLAAGEDALGRGDAAAGEAAFLRVLEADPEQPAALRGLAAARAAQDRWPEAAEGFARAVEHGVSDTDTLMNWGYAALRAGDAAAARTAFQRATAGSGGSVKAFYNLAIAERQAGDLEAAIRANVRAIELAPTFTDAQYNLANLYLERRSWDEAVAAFQRVLELDRTNVAAYNNLGIAHWRQGDLENALRMWREALRIDPDCEVARVNLNRFGRQAARPEGN